MVEAVLLSGGSIGSATHVACQLGLRNRFELARLLKREGLPPLHDLANWGSVLVWTECADSTGSSLCQLAFRGRRDPAVCYRAVRHTTGLQWREVKVLGPGWVLKQFLAQCKRISSSTGERAPSQPRCVRGPLG